MAAGGCRTSELNKAEKKGHGRRVKWEEKESQVESFIYTRSRVNEHIYKKIWVIRRNNLKKGIYVVIIYGASYLKKKYY